MKGTPPKSYFTNIAKRHNLRRLQGFTIVELLIVVVVIALLAAITVVAYNGITNQARQTRHLASIDSYEKALLMFKSETGAFPTIANGRSQAYLGGPYPATENLAEGECYKWYSPDYTSTARAQDAVNVNSALNTYLTAQPQLDMTEKHVTNGESGYFLRGAYYYRANTSYGPSIFIMFAFGGDGTCGRGSQSSASTSGASIRMCALTLSVPQWPDEDE